MEKIIFFDLDDTLYQRRVPFYNAYAAFFGQKDHIMEKIATACDVRGNEVFEDAQSGKITMDAMYIYRYTKGFGDLGVKLSDEDALRFRDLYQEMQGKIELTWEISWVLDMAEKLYDKIGIISNGPGEHQRKKMKLLGLERWVDQELIFLSGETGISKPDERVFRMIEEKTGLAPSALTMVGDSKEYDIDPAENAGWNTIHAVSEKALADLFVKMIASTQR